VYGRQVVLRTFLDPLDGRLEPAGERERERLLGVDVQLGAETSTHVRGQNPEPLLRNPADHREHLLEDVRNLG
jgi:hypothetical protein